MIAMGVICVTPAYAQMAAASPVIEMREGRLTATFPEKADDAALADAVPTLIARGVTSVNLRTVPVSELRPLSAVTGLQELNLSGTLVRDIGPLAALTGLRTLNLQFVRVRDLDPIAGLTELRSLNLGGTDVKSLAPLAKLRELRDLVVAVTEIKDLRPLIPLRQLETLDLGTTWVSSLRPVSGLLNLRTLRLNGTPVDTIEPLAGLRNLRELDIGGTQVSDLQPLSHLLVLRSLNLEGTRVADLSPLSQLPALRSVAAGGSLVTDMTLVSRLASGAARAQLPDQVSYWNERTTESIETTRTDPFEAARALAIESIAVFDTLRSIQEESAFLVRLPPPRQPVSSQVAIAAAAHYALTHLFPARRVPLDAAFATALASEPGAVNRQVSIEFGEAIANGVLMRRGDDDMTSGPAPPPAGASGTWQPTPPAFLPPAHPGWGSMEPFAMRAPSQFRPPGPPAIDSVAFREAKAAVAAIGAADSPMRTPAQTEIARYWSDSLSTYAPAGHWNAIATSLAAASHLDAREEATLLAELNVAMADAAIALGDAKYTYWFWRPITAIRAGGTGDAPVPTWTPLLETPNHPSYISGHSAFSGAAATVLTDRLGSRSFSSTSSGQTRHYDSFDQAAREAADSRLYGGIHFPFDIEDGLGTGRAIGAWTATVFRRLTDDRGPFLMMERSRDTAGIIGCAFDNLSPVSMVTVRLDNGDPVGLTVDGKGWFALPPLRLGHDNRHEIVLSATSVSGRANSVRMMIDGDNPDAVPAMAR